MGRTTRTIRVPGSAVRSQFPSDYGIEVSSLEVDPQIKETPVKYLCLVYGEEKEIGSMTDDECMAYDQTLRNAGRCLASEALQPVHTAATVRVRNGKVSVRDGPFTETKEHLAGFYLIDATDLNEAIQVASQIPPARVGSIEVRPVRELTSTSGERRRL
jgi:hypothetical protein